MNDPKIFDVIIVGGGPAGVAGVVYSARKQLSTLLITEEFGGQSIVSESIYNWIGTPKISGADLAKSLESHARDYEGEFLNIVTRDRVVRIDDEENITVHTHKGQVFQAKSLFIASGSRRRSLDIPGAKEFENKGIVYCASCDGPLFSGLDVAVIGGGNAGFESAAQLLAYVKSVTLIHRGEHFKADEITVKNVLAHPNMHAVLNAEPLKVLGQSSVTGLVYRDKKSNSETTLAVGGVFVEIGQIPNNDYLGSLLEKDEFGRIKVNPHTQQTSHKKIWAAGDVTDGLFHQNNIAAGDAVKALEHLYLTLKTQ